MTVSVLGAVSVWALCMAMALLIRQSAATPRELNNGIRFAAAAAIVSLGALIAMLALAQWWVALPFLPMVLWSGRLSMLLLNRYEQEIRKA